MTTQPATRPPETTTTRTETIHPYPIQQVWKRGGFYVARLTGEDPKYGVGREFVNGKPVKARRLIEVSPRDLGELPAWILRRPDEPCTTCSQTRPTRDTGEDVLAAYDAGWVDHGRVFGVDDLLAIHTAGPPGSTGAWQGDRCTECGTTPVFAPEATCQTCTDANRARAELAAMPAGEVF